MNRGLSILLCMAMAAVGGDAVAGACRVDSDCVFNPVDCSECGRCPDSMPQVVSKSQVDELKRECAKHPPVRLNPKAREQGLAAPACSPCPRPPDPLPLWRPVCRKGTCRAEPAGFEKTTTPGGVLVPGNRAGNVWLELTVLGPLSHAWLRVDKRGKLTYWASSMATAERNRRREAKTIRLKPARLASLRKLVKRSGLFSRQGRFDIKGQDCTSVNLALITAGKRREFSCRCKCPPRLKRIRTRLEKLLGQPILVAGF